MSERLNELLQKINQDGVKKAEEKAKAIETEANLKAEKILNEAKSKSEKIIQLANAEAEKVRLSGEATLKQASRDLILRLKE